MAIQKTAHKLLNLDNKNRHFLANLLTKNRNIRNLSQNKCGPREKIEKNDKYSNKNFINKAQDIYNMVPRQLTLLRDHYKFKKCIRKFTINPSTVFRIPNQIDYKENLLIDYCNIIDPDCNQ